MLVIPLGSKTTWTTERVAFTHLSAALVEVCVSAIFAITENVICVISQHVVCWALEHGASSFLISTSVQILK
jgi:hypothetical protein